MIIDSTNIALFGILIGLIFSILGFVLGLIFSRLNQNDIINAEKPEDKKSAETRSMDIYLPFINCLDDACYITQKDILIAANKVFIQRPFGVKPIMGKSAWDLWGGDMLQSISYPEVRDKLKANIPVVFGALCLDDNGVKCKLYVKIKAIDLENEIFIILVTDRTALLEAQRAAEQDRMILDKAQKVAGFGYWYASPGSSNTIWSSDMYEMFGINTPELFERYQGDSRWELLHEADRLEMQRDFYNAFNEGSTRDEVSFRIVRPDGELRHLRNKLGVLKDKDGEVILVVGVLQDVTTQVHQEDRIRHVQKMEALGELTGGLSHDFNNLLHVILGSAELLPTPEDPDDVESLQAIKRAAKRSSELIQRLLAFSRKQHLDPQNVNVNKCVENLLSILGSTMGKSIDISIDQANDLLESKIDEAQLESTIISLAINARHSMPLGGLFEINTQNVYLDDSKLLDQESVIAGDYINITVRDNGQGMSTETAKRVFEPFFTTKNVGEGSGLGLSMVYGFIKQSGGHISLQSQVGIGTSVDLYLPVSQPVSITPHTQGQMLYSKLEGKVLLIEDDAHVLTLTRKFLESAGFTVIQGNNTRDAINAIKKHKDFDYLLCDVILPDSDDGPEIAKRVAKKIPDIKVVFMSGYSNKEINARGIENTSIVLLQKPFRKVDLLDKLKQVVIP